MTKNDLKTIETSLGFVLPAFYKDFMLAYPPSLPDAKPKDWESLTQWEFADNPKLIIEWNRYVRGRPVGTFVDGPWPDKYFVIGAEYGGNYYVIDRHGDEQTVYLWMHDTGEFYDEAESLPEFVDWLIDYFWQFKEGDEKAQTDSVAERIKAEMALAASKNSKSARKQRKAR